MCVLYYLFFLVKTNITNSFCRCSELLSLSTIAEQKGGLTASPSPQIRMENISALTPLKQPIVFQLEGFYVLPGHGPFFFSLLLLYYAVTLWANGSVLCVIVTDQNLHRPMYVLVCNLAVCDLLGATAVAPRLMMHFLTGQRKIAYVPALAQAFSVHMYGVAVQTVLGVMAYDR